MARLLQLVLAQPQRNSAIKPFFRRFLSSAVVPRRSVLYVPGSNIRAQEKAHSLDADSLIFDLEDAVSPLDKCASRLAVDKCFASQSFGRRERVIRVNGCDTEWHTADVKMSCESSADAILLPKVECSKQIRELDLLMNKNGAQKSMKIWAMLETPKGILNAEKIASASGRLTVLVMGTSDLQNELRARNCQSRMPLLTSFGHSILAARATQTAIIDGVHLDLKDNIGFEDTCRQGRDMGFDGRTLIHPNQISYANDIYSPSIEEIEKSQRIIDASKTAEGKIFVLDGKLVENLHVIEATRILDFQAAIERLRNNKQ